MHLDFNVSKTVLFELCVKIKDKLLFGSSRDLNNAFIEFTLSRSASSINTNRVLLLSDELFWIVFTYYI